MSQRNVKSTTREQVAAGALAVVIAVCTAVYLVNGNRGWLVFALIAILFLIAVVAGIAER